MLSIDAAATSFSVKEQLADLRAIPDRIETDLWDLIEHRHPNRDEVDGLLEEERKYAAYHRSRLACTWAEGRHQNARKLNYLSNIENSNGRRFWSRQKRTNRPSKEAHDLDQV